MNQLQPNASHSRERQSFKYQEGDGFMRGARIAEKIQEFYGKTPNIETNNTNSRTLTATNQSINIRTNRVSNQQS